MVFEKRTDETAEGENRLFSRHEVWRRSYRLHPYLRSYSEEDFLQHAVQAIKAMAPHFIVGGKKLPRSKMAELMERWTHVMEAAEHHRLDMKKIQRRLHDIDSLHGGAAHLLVVDNERIGILRFEKTLKTMKLN